MSEESPKPEKSVQTNDVSGGIVGVGEQHINTVNVYNFRDTPDQALAGENLLAQRLRFNQENNAAPAAFPTTAQNVPSETSSPPLERWSKTQLAIAALVE